MEAFDDSADNLFYLLGLLNTPVGDYIFKLLNPTISLQIGNFQSFPVLNKNKKETEQIAKCNVKISKDDWNTYEISWDFKKSTLI